MFYTSNEDDDIYNLRSMDVETGDIIQYTDVLGGNFSPSIIKDARTDDDVLMFTSYYKGNYGLYRLPMDEPVKEITSDLIVRTEGPVIDFVPPVSHQIISENKRKKGTFEKFYIDGAPPIDVGVTSGGDFFGGTGISFSDVLGDQNFTFYALSVREFRTYLGSYTNRAGRFQYTLSGFDSTSFFFASPVSFQPGFSRDDSLSTIRQTGATASAVYPLSRFRRLEVSTGIIRQRTRFEDPFLDPDINTGGIGFPDDGSFDQFQDALERRYPNGTVIPLTATFVQETTRFRNFGPIAGSSLLAGVTVSPGGPFLSRQTINLDARKYFQLGGASLLAMRVRGLWSDGENPDLFWFGGNGDLRGFEYLSFVGNKGFFANAELRFPIIDAAITPIGFFGPLAWPVLHQYGRRALPGRAVPALLERPARVFAGSPLRSGRHVALRLGRLRPRRRGGVLRNRPHVQLLRPADERQLVQADRFRHDRGQLEDGFLGRLYVLGDMILFVSEALQIGFVSPRRRGSASFVSPDGPRLDSLREPH